MSNPVPADEQPIPDGVIAAVDETVIEQQGGVTYCLVAAIFNRPHIARRNMEAITDCRTRPFHWHKEGPRNRETAIEHCGAHVDGSIVLVRRAGRRAQITARATLLSELITELANEGVEHVIIESQGRRDDGRDRAKILDCFRVQPDVNFTYDWRTKTEPLLWYPDTLAGVVREYLTEGTSANYDRLRKVGVITDVRYVN